MYATVARVTDPSLARVLIVALRAHGFSPPPGGEDGIPGLPGVPDPRGIAIQVPQDEAADAKLLLDDLLKQMQL